MLSRQFLVSARLPLGRGLASGASDVAHKERGGVAETTSQQDKAPSHSTAKYQPELKISRLSNSLMVSSLDTNKPNSRLAFVFKAGSRYEKHHNLGVAHRICAQAGLASENNSTYSTAINAGLMGAQFQYKLTRDLLVFQIELPRDHATDGIMLLGDAVCRPSFKTWELDFSEAAMAEQSRNCKANREERVMTLLHRAAYRTQGLANPTHSPEYMIGKHTSDMCREYHEERFLSGEGGVIAENVEHQGLLTYCTDVLPVRDGLGGMEEKSTFYSGEERRELGGHQAHVLLAGEGPVANNLKELATYAVLSHLLGSGPVAPWSEYMGHGAIGQAFKGKGVVARTVERAYADSGIFGVYLHGDASNMRDAVLSASSALLNLASAPISDADIADAKVAAETEALSNGEDGDWTFKTLIRQSVIGGKDFASPPEFADAISQVTGVDVSRAAKKTGGKLAMSAVGNLTNTPYLDEIRS